MSMTDIDTQLARATTGGGSAAIPMPPKFDDPMKERAYVKTRLAGAFRVFADLGYDDGLAGHITVRDPVEPETFWVNPVGLHFGRIKASDLVRLDHQGQLVEGKALVNQAAFAIHSRLHVARPDVTAIAHAHSTAGKAWSTLGQPLDPITQDACVFFEDHAVFGAFSGVVEDLSEGDAIAESLGGRSAAILQNHGLLTVGPSVDIAAARFIQMDRACEVQLLAEAAGRPKLIDADIARKTRSFNGSSLAVWGYFQPLYQRMLDADPRFQD